MKRITLLLAVMGLTLLALAGFLPNLPSQLGMTAVAQANVGTTLMLDVACDCRMGSPAFFGGGRGDAWIVSGKIFPAGTLPTGDATNDPTLPVGGIAPIGNWTCRGQNALPFPPEVGDAYSDSPGAFNTQYFILNDGRALTVEGYALPGFIGELLSVTGGIGGFRGAGGDVQEASSFGEEAPLGTNATGCPNFRAKFTLRPGSVGPVH